MKPLRVLIVDDERPARARLRRLLGSVSDVVITGEAGDGREAVAAIRKHHPDVVLLDVQMPRLDGFGVAAALGSPAPALVFVTAYDEFALRAFDVEAVDYLLKPVQPERLAAALDRARRARTRDGRPGDRLDRLDRLLQRLDRARPAEHLLVHEGSNSVFVRLDEVSRVEAARNVVALHAGGRRYTLRLPLGRLEARLDPERWIRINRSELVQIGHIARLEPWFHGEFVVVLKDGRRTRWTRRYVRNAGQLLERDQARWSMQKPGRPD